MKKKVDYEWIMPYKIVTSEYCMPNTITFIHEPTVTTGSITAPVIYGNNLYNGPIGTSMVTLGASTTCNSSLVEPQVQWSYQYIYNATDDWYGSVLGNTYPCYGGIMAQPPETAEEKAARLKRAEEVEARRKAASLRAEHLLFTILTPSQVKQYTDDDFIELVVKGRTYRIRKGYSRNVELIEAGKPTIRYCAHPADAYRTPVPDAMLAQLLMIQHNEAEFLKVANRTVLQ